ncbi:MAG: VWA domain-containing protein [Planctomycetes bacterium]|nr:VWA domain-containing protein [Planctomycetota bacterium]
MRRSSVHLAALILLEALPFRFAPIRTAMGGELLIAASSARESWERDLALPEGLKLCLGGSLFSSPAVERSRGQVPLELLEAYGYQAYSPSWDDLARGEAAELAALASRSKIIFLCANARAAGAPLGKPWAVCQAGGRRIGLLGVLSAPTGATKLPAGLEVLDPKAAVQEAIPRLAEADVVLLLVCGEPQLALDLLKAFPRIQLCLFSAGGPATPEPVEIGGRWLWQVPRGGGILSRGAVAFEGKKMTGVKNAFLGGELVEAYARRRQELLAARGLELDPAVRITRAARPPAGIEEGKIGVGAAALEPGKFFPLGLSAHNRAVRLRIPGMALQASYGEVQAPRGRQLLVLDTEWQNLIPLTLVYENQVPTEYRIPQLGDHLYSVVNGRELARLPAEPPPGHLPVRDFRLERIGSTLRGKAVFEVAEPAPGKGFTSLELRFYDYAHGHAFLPLLAAGQGPEAAAAKAVAPLAKNEVVEGGIFGLARAKELDGPPAPEGMVFISLDFRARSLFELQAEAAAFRPGARKGEKLAVGTVADWQEAHRHSQLVVDGEYGFAPRPESALPPSPRFLPDVMTGGSLVFLAPDKSSSLELRCEFPNARAPGRSEIIRPRALTFSIEGVRPALPEPESLAKVEDGGIFEVGVLGQGAAAEFAGVKAEEEKFLILDVLVKNRGEGTEFFQTREQLKYTAESGEQRGIDEASFQGPHPPADLLLVPGGERRRFQAVYKIPKSEKRPRLAYAGVTLAKVLDLKPLEEAPAVAVAGPPKEGAKEGAKPPAKQKAQEPPPPALADKPDKIVKAEKEEEKKTPEKKPAKPPARKKAGKEAGRIAARQDRQPQGIAGVGLTAEQVNRAIDRGAEFLWNLLKEEIKPGYPLGYYHEHYLACQALVHAGAHRRFPDFDARLHEFLAKAQPWRGGTYLSGIFAMTIEGYGDPSFLPQLRRAARYLLENQGPQGSFGYGVKVAEELFHDPAEDRALRISGGQPLEGPGAAGEELKRLTEWEKGQDGDNSCSQFSLLGLHTASRSRLRQPAEVWKRNLEAYRKRQNPDGGWGYTTGGSYGSMSCAGICALAICRHELGEGDPAADEGIEKGLAWLDGNFSVTENPQRGDWTYYYLYSLERVGRILDTEFIGEHEWYPVGARQLVSAQLANGSWVGEGSEKDPRLATGFALLFLTRATPTLKVEMKRGGKGILKTGIALSARNRYYIILDGSGSMLAEMEGKQKFEIARDAVAALINDLADSSEVALRVYGHRKRSIEPGSNEDTALEIPMKPLAKKEFLAKLKSLRARGKTPLARSLLEARRDLSGAGEENPVTAVLLTDGGEDTLPRQDPLKAAEEFGKLKGVSLHVIGFDIGREDWSKQLLEIAARAGGRYWPATRSAALYQELRAAVLGVPEQFIVLDQGQKEAARGSFGDSRTLAEGKYTLKTDFAGQAFQEEFWINTDATTAVIFNAEKASGPGSKAAKKGGPAAKTEPSKPPAAANKFCTGCGKPLKPGARFCTDCGAKVKG